MSKREITKQVAERLKRFDKTTHDIHELVDKVHKQAEKTHKRSQAIRERTQAIRKGVQASASKRGLIRHGSTRRRGPGARTDST